MIRLLTRNIWWKLLSLGVAFAIWYNIASEPELATIVAVPVEYRNYPKDLIISSDIAGTVNLEARGPARQLRELPESHPAAIVDLASVLGPGERTFNLTRAELSLPAGIEFIRTVPAQLRFRFEHKLTRMLAVDTPWSGALPAGVVLLGKEVKPAQLNVSGPESHVIDAKRLLSDPFDLSNVTKDTERTLVVYASDPELRFLTAPQVTVKIRVRKTR